MKTGTRKKNKKDFNNFLLIGMVVCFMASFERFKKVYDVYYPPLDVGQCISMKYSGQKFDFKVVKKDQESRTIDLKMLGTRYGEYYDTYSYSELRDAGFKEIKCHE